MILHDPLCACLLDLSARLGGDCPLVVGGGYGLYLKQRMLLNQGTRTRFPQAQLPENRTTQDIDLILHADIVVSAERMRSLRDALDSLGCSVIKGSEYLQFTRPAAPAGEVKIDVLVGPLGDRFDPVTMKRNDRRVRPRGFKLLHARPLDEAVAVDQSPMAVAIEGIGADGVLRSATVHVPQPFTYLVMKLLAFRDRASDPAKDHARHHALDFYRIIGLMTEPEDAVTRELAEAHCNNPKVQEARQVVADSFLRRDRIGVLRLREHPLYRSHMELDPFIEDLAKILPPP